MKIVLGQLNPKVGDVEGNLLKVKQVITSYGHMKPDLIVFPELYLSGYPPQDLLDYPSFIDDIAQAIGQVQHLSEQFPDTGIILGAPIYNTKATGKRLFNAAVFIYGGKIIHSHHKILLPNYDIFDETRYFEPGTRCDPVLFKGRSLGVTVCEDAWKTSPTVKGLYRSDPVADVVKKGAELIINISASPFFLEKDKIRYETFATVAKGIGKPVICVNQIGANDDIIFDGTSLVIDDKGDCLFSAGSFVEDTPFLDMDTLKDSRPYSPLEKISSAYDALVLGLRDYVSKSRFQKVVIGLSGGIDSAVTACIAVAALGAENVLGVGMPSGYSSPGSVKDAEQLARNLGIGFKLIPIHTMVDEATSALHQHYSASLAPVAKENIQARLRGLTLMAISNNEGRLVITTGNKSELAVGYCTLYGDMNGGLNVLADVAKTMVYKIADYINREKELIPQNTIKKAPSAELRPGQTDQDTLPPYEVLDKIVYYYVEEHLSARQIIAKGFDPDTVKNVIDMVGKNEYKRYQAAPGLKITAKAFGKGRRMPIVARYP